MITTHNDDYLLIVTQIAHDIIRNNIHSVIMSGDADRVEVLLEFLLKLRNDTRWQYVTAVSAQALWNEMFENQDITDVMIFSTNEIWLRLQMMAGFPYDDLVAKLARSIALTRPSVNTKGTFTQRTEQHVAPATYRERGLTEEEWKNLFHTDPWLMTAYLFRACHLDPEIMVAELTPKKRPARGG